MAVEDGLIEIDGTKLKVVTLDFETYYDKEYTLSSKTMNMSEYIRDERFHAHGIGIKIGNGKTFWYTGKNIALALKEIDWSKSAMLAHNTPFDGFICSHVYGVKPAVYLDTLSMARAAHGHHMRHNLDTIAKAHGLPGKTRRAALDDTKGKQQLTDREERALGAYCVDDVDDTYQIFWKLYDHIPDEELEIIHITMRMFCDPVLLIDIPRVQAELDKEVGAKQAALLKSKADVKDLMSNHRFAELLKKAGFTPPMKISLSTGKQTFAFAKTDDGFKELLNHKNSKVRTLAEARLRVKSTIGETRAARFLEAGKDGMKLPILLNYSGAHTHRWSGGNKMNLQNLKRGGELRRSIMAPKGYVIVVADSSQIEARLTAYVAGQHDLVEAFAKKRDVYSEFASDIYGRPIDRKKPAMNAKGQYLNEVGQIVATKDEAFRPDELEGFVGKTCVLGLGFGMGAARLRTTLAAGLNGPTVIMTQMECQRIVNIYRSRNYAIKQLWKKMDGVISSMLVGQEGELGPITYGKGYIQLPNGLFLQYYGLHGDVDVQRDDLVVHEASYITKTGRAKIYGGLLTENVIQALARCIVAENMLTIDKMGYRVVSTTHDEIIVTVPEKQADKCLKDMLQVMSTPPTWAPGLPLAAEGGWDRVYSK